MVMFFGIFGTVMHSMNLLFIHIHFSALFFDWKKVRLEKARTVPEREQVQRKILASSKNFSSHLALKS